MPSFPLMINVHRSHLLRQKHKLVGVWNIKCFKTVSYILVEWDTLHCNGRTRKNKKLTSRVLTNYPAPNRLATEKLVQEVIKVACCWPEYHLGLKNRPDISLPIPELGQLLCLKTASEKYDTLVLWTTNWGDYRLTYRCGKYNLCYVDFVK